MTAEVAIAIVSKILKFETNHVLKNLDSAEIWDSFSRIEVIVDLEDELGVRFSIEEISQIATVRDLLDAIKGKS